jgi:hypothetical protein
MNLIAPNIKTPSITQTADNTDISITGSGLNSAIELNSTAGVLIEGNPTISFSSYGTLSATSSSSGITSSVGLITPTITIGTGSKTNLINYNNGTGLTCDDKITLPAQTTYSSGTTYGDIASTQAFVQSAVNSIDTGDVFLGSNNNFTGENNFNNNINGGTTSNIGLTIVGNNQIGEAEADIICINQTSNLGLNIYAGSTTITSASIPKIQIFNDGTATTFNTDITLPTQTAYNSGTTYADIASTQAFVKSAINSISAGGDVYLNGDNNFTGTNTFNTFIPTTTISQTFPSTNENDFASIGYVNSLASPLVVSTLAGLVACTVYGSSSFTSSYIGGLMYYEGYVNTFVPTSNFFSFTLTPNTDVYFGGTPTNVSLYNVSTGTYWSTGFNIVQYNAVAITSDNYPNGVDIFNLVVSGRLPLS